MTKPLLTLGLSLTLALLPTTSQAGRRDGIRSQVEREMDRGPSANAGDIPVLARLLERTGWTPTPELSGAFRPGFIFQATELGHRLQVEDCFPLEPTVSTYTATEVVTQLQAGVSVDLGAGSVGVSGGMVKKVKFSTPEQHTLPMLKLQPTTACTAMLKGAARGGVDLSSLYVVQEVLTARIAEQTCGRVDAQGRFVALGGAELELAMSCAQESLDPVAIAYRTVPVEQLMGRAGVIAEGSDPPRLSLRPSTPAQAVLAAPVPAVQPAPVPAVQPAPVPAVQPAPVPALQPAPVQAVQPAAPAAEAAEAAEVEQALQVGAQIHFETGTANLTGQSKMYLDKVVTTLKSMPTLRIRVEGHTDSMGDDAANLRISQQRADAVRSFLISMGVPADRLEAVGYGETRPIASNQTAEGRARNRRTAFEVISY